MKSIIQLFSYFLPRLSECLILTNIYQPGTSQYWKTSVLKILEERCASPPREIYLQADLLKTQHRHRRLPFLPKASFVVRKKAAARVRRLYLTEQKTSSLSLDAFRHPRERYATNQVEEKVCDRLLQDSANVFPFSFARPVHVGHRQPLHVEPLCIRIDPSR